MFVEAAKGERLMIAGVEFTIIDILDGDTVKVLIHSDEHVPGARDVEVAKPRRRNGGRVVPR